MTGSVVGCLVANSPHSRVYDRHGYTVSCFFHNRSLAIRTLISWSEGSSLVVCLCVSMDINEALTRTLGRRQQGGVLSYPCRNRVLPSRD